MVFLFYKMAKRSNPFIEDFIPQSKVHVGMKQFNNNDDRLKKVYEKTLDLLFKGAKKNIESGLQTSCDSCPNKKDKMKQLFIGKDGSLSHSGHLVLSEVELKVCKCGGSLESQCAYCDRVLCAGCQHGCTKCACTYCAHCILIGSEGSEVCVSCYG